MGNWGQLLFISIHRPGEHAIEVVDTVPADMQTPKGYGRGTIWIDNVQLEAKDHPTPFVDGTRPPHDEYIPQVLEGTG